MLEVERKGKADDLAFARTREEMDNLSNKEKEDRVIITGIKELDPNANGCLRKISLEKHGLCGLQKIGSRRIGQHLADYPRKEQ